MSNFNIITSERYEGIFKALANPHRLEIFIRLTSGGSGGIDCCPADRPFRFAGDPGNNLGNALSTVSHHLKELFRAGLTRTRRQGQRIECRVDHEILNTVSAFFNPATPQ